MKTRGHITCPRCGADVKVPLYWAVGIEGIFRCRECRLPFKTGYKMGAVLSALGLTLAVATVQLLVYLLSIYSMAIFILALIPLWLVYGYGLRKSYMLWKIRRYVRKHPQEASPPKTRTLPVQIASCPGTSYSTKKTTNARTLHKQTGIRTSRRLERPPSGMKMDGTTVSSPIIQPWSTAFTILLLPLHIVKTVRNGIGMQTHYHSRHTA